MKIKLGTSIVTALLCACLFSTGAIAAAARDKVPAAAKSVANPVDSEIDMKHTKKKLYKACKNCHGKKGDGKTAAAKDMDVKPPNWTAGTESTDGELFWVIMNGSKDTEMKGYENHKKKKKRLNADQAWTLVHYIRAFAK
jgi:mono/diheme cytochrome c family protein